ncbi:MAG: PG0541 family transporter-associated protein [Bacteroidales bacterium]|jgi:nitrogen regulatory protein PII
MKAVMIVFNQAHTERVEYMFDRLGVRGYSLWENVQGRGSNNGVPHLGTHAWPEINKIALAIIDNELADDILSAVKKIDSINEEVGIRAFVWDIEKMV